MLTHNILLYIILTHTHIQTHTQLYVAIYK